MLGSSFEAGRPRPSAGRRCTARSVLKLQALTRAYVHRRRSPEVREKEKVECEDGGRRDDRRRVSEWRSEANAWSEAEGRCGEKEDEGGEVEGGTCR